MNDIITEVSREKSRFRVAVNGEEVLWFPKDAFWERSVAVDEAVDIEELKEWLLPRQYPEALNRAVGLLAVRSRSSLEVQQKLEAKGYMGRVIELVLYKLTKERFLDDRAFAREWAAARVERQLGKRRIVQELRQKGIGRELAEQALEKLEAESDMEEPARRLAAKLIKRVQKEPDERKGMQKVMAAMARRGFSYEESRHAVEAALAEDGEL